MIRSNWFVTLITFCTAIRACNKTGLAPKKYLPKRLVYGTGLMEMFHKVKKKEEFPADSPH